MILYMLLDTECVHFVGMLTACGSSLVVDLILITVARVLNKMTLTKNGTRISENNLERGAARRLAMAEERLTKG